jgi:hypothetical protein
MTEDAKQVRGSYQKPLASIDVGCFWEGLVGLQLSYPFEVRLLNIYAFRSALIVE